MQAATRVALPVRKCAKLAVLAASLVLIAALQAGAQENPTAGGTGQAQPAENPGVEENTNVGRWYQVELILFSRRETPEVTENWPRFPDLTSVEQARPLWQPPTRLGELQTPLPAGSLEPSAATPLQWPLIDPETGTEKPFVILPQSELQLREEAAAINDNRNRSVVLHTGWNMPVQGEADADFFRLHSELDSTPRQRTMLDGTLRVYVGRFLHVATQLYATDYQLAEEPLRVFFGDSSGPELTPELASADTRYGPWRPELRRPGAADSLAPQWVPSQSIRFTETRRMRSNELHYLDHPRLGLVIRFTPYEPYDPSAPEEETTDDTETAPADDAVGETADQG